MPPPTAQGFTPIQLVVLLEREACGPTVRLCPAKAAAAAAAAAAAVPATVIAVTKCEEAGAASTAARLAVGHDDAAEVVAAAAAGAEAHAHLQPYRHKRYGLLNNYD